MLHPYALDKPLAALIGKLPHSVMPVMRFATFIAAPLPIALILSCMLGYALYAFDHELLRTSALVVLTAPIAELSKFITRRKRPETLYVERMRFKTFSFPSGHSYIAMLVFGFIAALIIRSGFVGTVAATSLIALIFTVGISRVYLGAHFPSDVIAGWFLGAVVLYGILITESSVL